ncbi:DNA/RNA-binding domain of Phe-tRNA-synthetase-like protein [Rhodobium orientis]|uniref:B3/B4 tRNA-binding domain-containing protein n=1 Tax=Rhodobium orientis TaxID=34017 RepID=A0A327JLP1_9HYPH|nr:phenylalanine--tRNA ligase beta subunit-related protein [Rhodobium orientis]MBB4304882.1 DNA/RNA-binding domain of Phe-tRNA-synthetase-like protein [Rhodobium orientis]MBK5949211.1 hypothetical protein [Rhodobium orientis]RAI27380.1 hypothetical protein CH339_10605 [Rhodobium orientis]
MKLDITDIISDFPAFRVAVLIAKDLSIRQERPAELDAVIAERMAACREHWGDTALAEIPGIAVWRRAYRAFGIKQTSYRSSVERLVKNVLAGRDLVAINGFVDAYNVVSLSHVFPAGADDLNKVDGDIAFRPSRPGDSFRDMAPAGVDGVTEAPPKPGEVVYADVEKILCRRWNWRQDARSLVTPETKRAVLTIQSLGEGDLEAAVADATDLIERFSGATVAVTYADADAPLVVLAGA